MKMEMNESRKIRILSDRPGSVECLCRLLSGQEYGWDIQILDPTCDEDADSIDLLLVFPCTSTTFKNPGQASLWKMMFRLLDRRYSACRIMYLSFVSRAQWKSLMEEEAYSIAHLLDGIPDNQLVLLPKNLSELREEIQRHLNAEAGIYAIEVALMVISVVSELKRIEHPLPYIERLYKCIEAYNNHCLTAELQSIAQQYVESFDHVVSAAELLSLYPDYYAKQPGWHAFQKKVQQVTDCFFDLRQVINDTLAPLGQSGLASLPTHTQPLPVYRIPAKNIAKHLGVYLAQIEDVKIMG